MSTSRLEKFIYAICSMDVSDLPVPLSRIEKLWNCLITGETPDFEPLSRNEKYLMAMLDRYDISNLPAPMSRGEKLLYKIAVGETDLSDVPGYLSRYEELLKNLIENGGISGGDFEYVLHTLNQSLNTLYLTAEKPVKSAILSGNTLVNLCDKTKSVFSADGNKNLWQNALFNTNPTQLTVINHTDKVIKFTLHNRTTDNWVSTNRVEANSKSLVNCGTNNYLKDLYGAYSDGWSNTEEDINILKDGVLILEGDHTQEDIPYFEGMQSVKMPVLTTIGKNLFNKEGLVLQNKKRVRADNGEFVYSTASSGFDNYFDCQFLQGKTINVSSIASTGAGGEIAFYTIDKTYIKGGSLAKSQLVPENAFYYRFSVNVLDMSIDEAKIQIEVNSVATLYEPYKSNILTVNEDVELRGIGDVRDELNLLTGELTQRVSGLEYIDQNSKLNQSGTSNDTTLVVTTSIKSTSTSGKRGLVSSHELIKYAQLDNWFSSLSIIFRLPKANENFATLTAFKQFLTQNPFYYYRELEKEEISIKTVDLTVVNQDNQPTKLGTFENVTHVSLEAENLIPEVEMEVATNLLEDTVFNLTNAFNTLYPTAAKPVKSAILTGQTSVNIKENQVSIGQEGRQVEYEIPLVKINTKYFIKYKLTSTSSWVAIGFLNDSLSWSSNRENQPLEGQFILNSGTNPCYFRIGGLAGTITTVDYLMIIEYQEGMENWNIPYFEGMQSVKMPVLKTTGKNLFDGKLENGAIISATGVNTPSTDNVRSVGYIKVNPNASIVISNDLNYSNNIVYEYDSNKNFIGRKETNPFTTSTNCQYIRFRSNSNQSNLDVKYQIEYGTQPTTYEPYKSTTLSTPSDLELRKVGNVQDELNVMTGELTERIGEVVLNGSESWVSHGDKINTKVYRLAYSKLVHVNDRILCDKLPIAAPGDVEKIAASGNAGSEDCYAFYIALSKTKANTLSDFKSYLSENPLTVQYELKTPTTKTVDLSVVDQDGNVTTLKTFDDTTHVLLNSEGLIPTASLTVRTKIPSASSTSLLMDDISNKQEQLETTVDKQSNNVDATMIATTEIFEETL